MPFSKSVVQVARPSIENSVAEGVVGFAWLVDPLSRTGSIDFYRLKPEELDEINLRSKVSCFQQQNLKYFRNSRMLSQVDPTAGQD